MSLLRVCLRLPFATRHTFFAALSLALLLPCIASIAAAQDATSPGLLRKAASSFVLQIGGAHLQIDQRGPAPDLSEGAIEDHIERAAKAVTLYFGRFPVPSAHIIITIQPGRDDIHGTTWGNVGGFPAVTQLRIGQRLSQQALDADWSTTHELVHMSLDSLPDEQHWLEEGLATYIEPIARAQAGELTPEKIWGDMFSRMHSGEPEPGDRGLNRTATWGRTYWGGAMFYLVADIQIRKQTSNTRGLEDALRAIVDAGGTIDKEWPITRILKIGDQATGTLVLEQLYASWSQTPVAVDLPQLWSQLGVRPIGNGRITFDNAAPLAQIRMAITTPRP